MNRPLLVAAFLTATSGVASAGIYGGLSVGPDAAVQDDFFDLTSPGRAVRLLGGYSFGRISAEASVTGNNLLAGAREVEHRQFGVFGKYNFPLGSNFEVFGRAGLQWVSLNFSDNDVAYTGKGIVFGPGVEYKLKFVSASASLRLDYTVSYATPANQGHELSFTSGQWMLGFTVGI